MTAEESIFSVTVTESELTLLISSLAYLEKRQLFLANMATNQGREKEALARRESAATTVQLSEKLYAIGAKEGPR
jgi:hypothetical protein